MKFILAFLLLFQTLTLQASSLQCESLFTQRTGEELILEINSKYNHKILNSEQIYVHFEQLGYLRRHLATFKLKRTLKKLTTENSAPDLFEIYEITHKIDQLLLSYARNGQNLSAAENKALSEAQRKLLSEGLLQYFSNQKNPTNSKYLKILSSTFSYIFNSKYWRWVQSPIIMPKLVGLSIPKELAEKVLLEGLEKHKAEVKKYIPLIETRAVFNKFSTIYNWMIVASVFTVLPYLTHQFYLEQVKIGEAKAVEIFKPLAETTKEMAEVNYALEKELGALEHYKKAFLEKYGRELTPEEIANAQKAIHETNNFQKKEKAQVAQRGDQ